MIPEHDMRQSHGVCERWARCSAGRTTGMEVDKRPRSFDGTGYTNLTIGSRRQFTYVASSVCGKQLPFLARKHYIL
jgi:hypothetical protein